MTTTEKDNVFETMRIVTELIDQHSIAEQRQVMALLAARYEMAIRELYAISRDHYQPRPKRRFAN